MKYRKATIEDAEGVANVLMQSYNIDSIEEGKNVFFDERTKSHHYIVADDNGKIAGVVTWVVHGLPKHQLAELDRIAVLPKYKGKGIAQELFNRLIEDAKEYYRSKGKKLRKLYILTHSSNERAQIFYKKMGCVHETTLKDHYYKGEDEFVFSIFFE